MYLTCTMAITTLSLVLTVVVLNIYAVNDHPVPDWAKRFILTHLAKFLCMRHHDGTVTGRSTKSIKEVAMTCELTRCAVTPQIGQVTDDVSGVSSRPPNDVRGDTFISPNDVSGITLRTPEVQLESSFAARQQLRELSLTDDVEAKMAEKVWAKEWQKLAEVVDRTFFCLFLMAVIVTTMLLFQPLT